MTETQINLICGMLIASVAFSFAPVVIGVVKVIIKALSANPRRNTGFGKQLMFFSAFLIGAIWCLRYAVGYYTIVSTDEIEITLTWWEELFNSMAHALQTFSMDEDYTQYILDGKNMLCAIAGPDTIWSSVYGLYASVLNFIAPIAGGAIIFDILASVFPRLKLHVSYLAVWREKYYFSTLNEGSLALAKSIYSANISHFARPTIIFTGAHGDAEDEKASKLFQEARLMGAVCVREDLSYIAKNRFGKRTFFLIAEAEEENLQMLTNLADVYNYKYLKKAEIYLFSQNDVYTQIEMSVRTKLLTTYQLKEEELPTFIPVQSYRNLISNMLVEVPLYEPLIHRRKGDGTVDLNVTILGTGAIGTEMFLSTYWFGQMLHTNLTVNIVSQDSEEVFWGKIDYVNPEIHHTIIKDDPILMYNQNGDCSEPYCTVNYMQCDVKSTAFMQQMRDKKADSLLLNTDYFLVALGTDEANLSVANMIRKYVGEYHISSNKEKRTVITYVVYDSELCEILNRKKHHCSGKNTDIYMQAIGCLQDVYSVKNVFMTEYEPLALKADQLYLSVQNRQTRAKEHAERMKDDYKHWASLARGMHIKYKVFSLGLFRFSVFDGTGTDDPKYIADMQQAYDQYKQIVTGEISMPDEESRRKHISLLHQLAWLEHRRWNAFTRVKGFRHTTNYAAYAVSGQFGSYKQMELKLHPCLVECDQAGIRASVNEKGIVDETTLFQCDDSTKRDLLDELSYQLYNLKYNDYDFKQYDYPITDF